MQESNQPVALDFDEYEFRKRRKDLLPWWVKVASWLYLVTGSLVAMMVPLMFFFEPELALYGLHAEEVSFTAVFIGCLFALKAVTAYGLLFEKKWAMLVGKIDGYLGLAVCIYSMVMLSITPGAQFNFRSEIIPLTIFLVWLHRRSEEWELGYSSKER